MRPRGARNLRPQREDRRVDRQARGTVIVAPIVPLTAPEIAERLGIEEPGSHLEEALTHPSYANEHRGAARDNQRLEFLGDAVLGLCVSELLMDRFPDAREGELSLMRAALVNTEALAEWARLNGVGDVLRLGRGADSAGERQQKNVLADAVEAIVGAAYLDHGIEAARRVAKAIVSAPIDRLASGPPLGRDPKSELQERVQARGGSSPKYRVIESIGPDHSREFVVAVEVDAEALGEGRGRSKKRAEQEAARNALESGHPLATPFSRGDLPAPRYTISDIPESDPASSAPNSATPNSATPNSATPVSVAPPTSPSGAKVEPER
ncbi:MAG: ribonuclease III [Polyangiaceae bacterium]|nr:ribonuclease III [Polyangiaceae bacterium]